MGRSSERGRGCRGRHSQKGTERRVRGGILDQEQRWTGYTEPGALTSPGAGALVGRETETGRGTQKSRDRENKERRR